MISFKKYIEDLFESRDKSYSVEWINKTLKTFRFWSTSYETFKEKTLI
jgi:hypothetical protein